MARRGDQPTREARRKWLHWVPLAFSQKLLLLLLIAAVVPTAISVLAFDWIMRQYESDRTAYDGASLGGVLAANLADHIEDGWTRGDRVLMDYLATDDSIAFICVTDATGRPIHMSVHDARAWDAYSDYQHDSLAKGRLDVSRQVVVGAIGENMVIRTVPIQPQESMAKGLSNDKLNAKGFVVLGIHDVTFAAAAKDYQLAQVIIAGGTVLLIAPLILLAYLFWTRPLRLLRTSVRKLADGQAPTPMYVSDVDDIGKLVCEVNRMTGSVLAAQRQLRDTNVNLESMVEQRTIELREVVRELEHLSTTDAMTGLANRRAFYKQLERDFARAQAFGSELSVLMVDLDRFKQVNDQFGHDVGDEVIIAAGAAIKAHCDTNMLPARLGGDEFVVLIRHLPLQECREMAEKLGRAFAAQVELLLARFDGAPRVTMSQGLALRSMSDVSTGEALVAQADVALYRSKSRGRSCLSVFDRSMAPAEPQNVRDATEGHMEAA